MPGPTDSFPVYQGGLPGSGDPATGAGAALGGNLFGALVGVAGGLILANQQEKSNLELARFQDEANRRYLKEQLEYNSPAAQMKRFQEAGLNPHLIYGQGSPGNQERPLQYPDIGRVDMRMLTSLIPLLNQTRMTSAQVDATRANTARTGVLMELNRLQSEVTRRNPLLNEAGFQAIIDSLKATAQLKEQDIGLKSIETEFQRATVATRAMSIERQIELLEQRFRLGELDGAMKAKLIESQEFKNQIIEIQKKFMAMEEISGQQVWQFISLLLMKFL